MTLVDQAITMDLRGLKVGYCSVLGGFKYPPVDWDCSGSGGSPSAYVPALKQLQKSVLPNAL